MDYRDVCLFCGEDLAGHDWRHCDGRQGAVEAGLGFTAPGTGPDHDGATYDRTVDHVRLNAQTLRVWLALQTGHWYTLAELHLVTGDPEASISARLRDLRKAKFGAHRIERRRLEAERGLYVYRLLREDAQAS
jgi:hypothetical protein